LTPHGARDSQEAESILTAEAAEYAEKDREVGFSTRALHNQNSPRRICLDVRFEL